jgi:hypothetical protein
VVFGESHLRHLLAKYSAYYNEARTHLTLDKDTPLRRPAQTVGRIASISWLDGLYRQYVSDGLIGRHSHRCSRSRWSGASQVG